MLYSDDLLYPEGLEIDMLTHINFLQTPAKDLLDFIVLIVRCEQNKYLVRFEKFWKNDFFEYQIRPNQARSVSLAKKSPSYTVQKIKFFRKRSIFDFEF